MKYGSHAAMSCMAFSFVLKWFTERQCAEHCFYTEKTGRKGTDTKMTRKCFISIFTLLLTLVLASCGQKEEKVRYAIITGTDGGAGDESYSAIISGVETFCGENGYTFQRYSATEDTEEGYAAQFEAAHNDGARYMVAFGKDMETAVYNAQNDYGKAHFLFFEGEPRKEAGAEESTIKKNTECLTFGKNDIGFLAGYTALRDGSRDIAFLSAENTGDTAAFYDGFRQGVAYAENELMLTSSDLHLYAEFCGSTELSPRRLGDALDFYNGGVDLIITDHQGIAEACDRAASAAESGAIAALGFENTSGLSHVKFAAVADREAGAKAYLTQLENEEAFVGGIVKELNAAQYAAKISADFSNFIAFGQDSYRSILNAMAQMSESQASSSEEEGGEPGSTYGFQDAESVPVTEVNSGEIAAHVTGGGSSAGQTETADGSTESSEDSASSESSEETPDESAEGGESEDGASEDGSSEDGASEDGGSEDGSSEDGGSEE